MSQALLQLMVLSVMLSGTGPPAGVREGDFALRARAFDPVAARSGHMPSVGGGFELSAQTDSRRERLDDPGRFSLQVSCASAGASGPCGCLCGSSPIFADGFESGDTTSWSSSTP
jgi:hypothetical protein